MILGTNLPIPIIQPCKITSVNNLLLSQKTCVQTIILKAAEIEAEAETLHQQGNVVLALHQWREAEALYSSVGQSKRHRGGALGQSVKSYAMDSSRDQPILQSDLLMDVYRTGAEEEAFACLQRIEEAEGKSPSK